MSVGFITHKKYVDQYSNYAKEKPLVAEIPDTFDSTSPINPHKLTMALKAFAFCGIKKPEPGVNLAHRLVESVNHPVVGKVDHYEIFDPKNDKPESRQQVFLVAKKNTPVVTMGINILTGASNEHKEINGISHLLEHMVFKATMNPDGTIKTGPKELSARLDSLGVDTNAWTSADNTLYMATCLKENFAEAMKVHSDMVLTPAIPEEELDKERSVVIEEIGIAKNNGSEMLRDKLLKKIFSPHPYKYTVLGPKKNIKEFSREDILAYHNNFYAPMNRQIFVIGNVSTEEALKNIKENYNRGEVKQVDIPARPAQSSKTPKTSIAKDETLTNTVESYLGFPGPEGSKVKDVAAMKLIGILLGELENSCLKKVSEKRGTGIIDSTAYEMQYKEGTPFFIYNTVKYDKREQAQDLVLQTLSEFIEKGPTPQELEKAKLRAEFDLVKDSEGLGGILTQLTDSLVQHSLSDDHKFLDIIRNISIEDIKEAANKYLDIKKAKVYNVIPKSPPKKSKKKKKVSFTGNLSPHDTKMKLDNGIELIVRKQPDNLMTSVTILSRGGNKLDNQKARIGLLSRMMTKGTISKSSDELIEAKEKIAMDLKISPEPDALRITAASLTRKQDEMLQLLGETIAHPRFLSRNKQVLTEVEKKLRKEKTGYKDDLSTEDDEAPISNVSAYDERHPYSDNTDSIAKNVSKVQLADIRSIYRKVFSPSNMVISVVGDVDPKHVQKILNESIGSLTEREVKIPEAKPLEIKENQINGVIRVDSKQAKISKVWKAPSIDSKDALAMRMLRIIMSYTNTSRLFTEFRNERKGLCYHVGARFSPFVDDGVFSFFVETNPKNVKKCMALFDEIVENLKTNKISSEELDSAKKIFKTSLSNIQTKTTSISTDISEHRTYNCLSNDEIMQKIDQLTVEDLNRVVEKYLFKPNVTTVFADYEVLEKAGIEDVR